MINSLLETVEFTENNFQGEYVLHLVTKKLRDFFYRDLCDFYLESTKPVLKTDDKENFEMKQNVWNILRNCINYTLLMYHPFMPSITEELWHRNKSINGIQKDLSILDFKYPTRGDFFDIKVS